MPETAEDLFGDPAAAEPRLGTGILPSQGLRALMRKKALWAEEPFEDDQVQPASLDLRLGARAWRIRASFLPGAERTVRERIDALAMHEIDLVPGAVLEKGCTYIAKLMEGVRLNRELSGIANPKSSIGRLDIFTRLVTDRGREYDRIEPGYKGPLYAEIAPLTFSVVVRKGSRLCQLRLKRGSPFFSEEALRELYRRVRGGEEEAEEADRRGFPVTVDVAGTGAGEGAMGGGGLIGYRAKRHAPLVDVDRKNYYDPGEFWEPLRARGCEGLVLNPDDFYILASKEAIAVPPDYAAEMVAYDTLVGEFRVHYAGFFDPGFGHGAEGGGTRAVLEVRSHEVPFVVEDGQIVGRLLYEKLAARPDILYGPEIGSSYQRQGLKLGKQFRDPGA